MYVIHSGPKQTDTLGLEEKAHTALTPKDTSASLDILLVPLGSRSGG